MRFEDGRESPFEEDYPEPERSGDDAKASRLASRLTAESVGPDSLAVQRQVFEAIARRRSELTQDDRPLEFIPRSDGSATIIFKGQILLRRGDYEGSEHASDARRSHAGDLRAYLERLGWRPARGGLGCPELEPELVRLENPAVDWPMLEALTRALRRRGIACTADHLAALAGPVGKALSAPFPSTGLGPFRPVEPTGEPIRVAIVDSGVDANERTDGWLARVPRVQIAVDPLNDMNGELQRSAGHGTFVAGVVQQVAPAADLTMYRVDGLADGVGSEVSVACAIIRAANPADEDGNPLPKPHVINLSLGCQTLDDLPPLALGAALERVDPGILVVAAAGNYGDSRPCWPAAFRRVVAVGGLTLDLEPTPWSSQGFWVDISTVGEGLRSTYVKGTPSQAFAPPPQPAAQVVQAWLVDNPWALWVGTSFAAPQICGAVARMCDELGLEPRTALAQLLRAARPMPGFGRAIKILPGV
jgi:hypothetical protein